jgi:hypothetical protein
MHVSQWVSWNVGTATVMKLPRRLLCDENLEQLTGMSAVNLNRGASTRKFGEVRRYSVETPAGPFPLPIVAESTRSGVFENEVGAHHWRRRGEKAFRQ